MTAAELTTIRDQLLAENSRLKGLLPSKPGSVTIRDIPQRGWTQFGVYHDREPMMGHHAEVIPGKSIRLFGTETNYRRDPFDYDITYHVSDAAEYDSYNRHYIGTIMKITTKSVFIRPYPEDTRFKRLDLSDFSRRNRHGLERKYKSNQEWTD